MALKKAIALLAGFSVVVLYGCGDSSPSAEQSKDMFAPHKYTRPGTAPGSVPGPGPGRAGPPKGTADNPR